MLNMMDNAKVDAKKEQEILAITAGPNPIQTEPTPLESEDPIDSRPSSQMEGKLISTSFRSNRVGEQSQNPKADQFIKQLKKKNLVAAAQPSPERNSFLDKIPKAHTDSTRKKIRL